MTVFNVSLDDTSPLITYNGKWTFHFASEQPNPDPYIQNYAGKTFHETAEKGGNATFAFFGSAIYVYGSLRSHHGSYVVHLDDRIWTSSAYSASPEFGCLIYFASGLDNAQHSLTIIDESTDEDQRWVDIDNIVFTTGDSTSSTTSEWSSTSATSNSFKWSGNWTTHADSSLNLDDTQHYSWTPGSNVSIQFQGPMVQLQGFTHPNAGQYSISIDGSTPQHFNASSPNWSNNSTLFFASGLSPGSHNLLLTNTGPEQTFVSVASVSTVQVKASTIALEVAGITMLIFGLLSVVALVSIIIRRRRREKQEKASGLRPYQLMKEPSPTKSRPRGPKALTDRVIPWPASRASTSRGQADMIRLASEADLEQGHSDAATYGSSRHYRDASSAPLLETSTVYRSPSEMSLELDPPDYTSPKPSMRAVLPQRQKHPYRA